MAGGKLDLLELADNMNGPPRASMAGWRERRVKTVRRRNVAIADDLRLPAVVVSEADSRIGQL